VKLINGALFQTELTPSDMTSMKYAPIRSVEVERLFSLYKFVVRPNRRSFNFENLTLNMIFHNNQNED